MSIQDKSSALKHIAELIEQFDLSIQDIQAYLAVGTPADENNANVVIKVLSYIGGIFIFAGIATYIALQWESFNSAARVIITLGSGTACFVSSVIALQDARYRRLGMPLLLIAALLQPTGMMVAFAEYGGGGDERIAALLTAITFALQFGFTFAKWRETVMLWLTLFFASAAWGLALDLTQLDSAVIALTLGIGWLCLAISTSRNAYGALSAQLFFFGGWAFLAGLFDLVEGTILETLFVIAACGLIYVSVWSKSRILNLVSTAGLLAYTAYFTGRYFAESIGWPIALILIGLVMMGISTLAVRIDRKYLKQN